MLRSAYLFLLIAITAMPTQQHNCACHLASAEDAPHGANESVVIIGKAVKRLQGTLSYKGGSLVNGAVVEIYNCASSRKDARATELVSNRKRLAACKTGIDGTFCFQGLPSGKYVLRAGTGKSEGWNEVYMIITLDQRWWSKWRKSRNIELTLSPGT